MATEVSICNLALSHLGDEATVASIDPPEGSAQAEHCASFYPVARDSLQEMHAWGFCTTRKALALLSEEPLTGWQLAYVRPSAAVRVLGIYPAGVLDDNDPQPFETEVLTDGTEVIYTNTEDAVCRYTFRVTDPSKFSPLFTETLSWLLASHLAGPILKGKNGAAMAQSCRATAGTFLADAKRSDARQRRVRPVHNVPWISGR